MLTQDSEIEKTFALVPNTAGFDASLILTLHWDEGVFGIVQL